MADRPTPSYADVILDRIDGGGTARLVCRVCDAVVYVRILWDHTETSVEHVAQTLTEAAQNHREECRG